MSKPACLFGPYFKARRLEQGISQWQIVHKTNGYLTNIQRVEKGITHPGVTPAFKLLKAIEVLPGDFLGDILAEHQDKFPTPISLISSGSISYERPPLNLGQKSFFGLMLRQARVSASISQTAMSKATNYHLRNMNAVETGLQEPGIMTALGLVLTTGVNVREFFNTLYKYHLECL